MSNERRYLIEGLIIFFLFCLFIYILLCFASCGTPRNMQVPQKDSIRTMISERIIYRDTIVYVPVPDESEKAVLQDTDTSRLQTGLAESEAFVSGGRLNHTLRNRHDVLQPIYLSIPEKARETEHFQLAARTVTVEVEKQLTPWQRFLQGLGQGAFVAGLAAILFIIVRIIRKFI